jgi:hypothetical protein
MMSEHVGKVCRIGQGHECCRYLMMGTKGFECAKVAEIGVKALLDQRVAEETMTPGAASAGGGGAGSMDSCEHKRTDQ